MPETDALLILLSYHLQCVADRSVESGLEQTDKPLVWSRLPWRYTAFKVIVDLAQRPQKPLAEWTDYHRVLEVLRFGDVRQLEAEHAPTSSREPEH